MGRSLPLSALVCACTWMVTACASSAPATFAGSMCRSHLRPAEAPLAEALDSAGLVADLSADWGPAHSFTVATVSYDAAGAVDSVSVWSEAMPDATKERVATTLRRHATSGQRGRPVHLFVGDDASLAPRRVRALLRCAPVLTNASEVSRQVYRESLELRRLGLLLDPDFGALSSTLWMSIAADGQVLETRVVRSSGRLAVDQAAARAVAAAAVFEPARIEGVAVPGWVELPVRIRMVDPEPPPPPPGPPTSPRR